MTTQKRALEWIVGRDTGTSSKTIWSVMQMVEPEYAGTPSDPDDFGRCYRLLKLIPEWRESLSLVAFAYPTWAPLIREWDALTAMFEDGQRTNWKSHRMYERMCVLNDEGMILAGWTLSRSGTGHGPGRGHRVKRELIEKALKEETPVKFSEEGTRRNAEATSVKVGKTVFRA